MRPLGIHAGGMVTNLGLSGAATRAAFRARLDNFSETRFMDQHGEWLLGAEIPLQRPLRGQARLVELAQRSVTEALERSAAASSGQAGELPLLLCLAGKERTGRLVTDEQRFFSELQEGLGLGFSAESRIIPQGKSSVVSALAMAEALLYDHAREYVVVLAVDSLLNARTLKAHENAARLLTRTTSNGFIPGEGAACVVFERAATAAEPGTTRVVGFGQASQPARSASDEPITADGFIAAIRSSLEGAGLSLSDVDHWFYDNDGSYQGAKETTIAELRLLRGEGLALGRESLNGQFGETGVAALLLMLLLFPAIAEPGHVGLLTGADESDYRSAILVHRVE